MDETNWTLDGEPVDLDASDLWEEDRALVAQTEVGEELVVGGGAFATFVLKRVA